MNKRNIILCLCTALVLLFSNGATVNAYPGAYYLNVSEVQQEKSKWCWAACSVAIMKYHGTNVSQTNFAIATHGDSNNTMASVFEIMDGLEYYGYSSDYETSCLDFSAVKNQIYTHHYPFMAITYSPTYLAMVGHVYVVSAYETSGGNQIYCMDPTTGIFTLWSYSSFINNANWLKTIYNIS